MRIRFLGGAQEVGRVGMLLNEHMLFDYGFAPAKPPKYPLPAPPIDVMMLTHAHLDHSGMIPWLCARSPSLHPIATPPTIALVKLLALDSIKVAKSEGYPSPFNEEHVYHMLDSMHPVTYGTHTIDGLEIGVHPSGHIPGSAMYLVDQTLFTGDLNTSSTHLLVGARPISCDTLVIEGTYVGREHPSRQQTEQQFLDTIDEVVDRGGLAIVAAFAVGRTQELLLLLQKRGYDVRLDGMGTKATRLMLGHPEYLRRPDDLLRAWEGVRPIRSESDRKRALDADVIVTTSGMLDGGPVSYYLQRVKDDAKSAVLLTGYQVEGTNGRRLLETGTVNLRGVVEKIRCQVDFFDLSAHAGHEELVQFIYACQPKNVVVFHSEHAPQLAEELADLDVYAPKNGETLEL